MQPMVARMALPRLGGTPAVWNSALVVYQALLLGGYLYAHLLGRLRPRTQAAVHLAAFVVAAAWLPIGLRAADLPANANPVLWVPWLFAGSIGPLFLVVAAQAPLMQRWYEQSGEAADPYWLYAASNLGSFTGLIAYPALLEPTLGLHRQSLAWSAGFVLLALLVGACAWRLPRSGSVVVQSTAPPPSLRRRLQWIALAAVPSGLILSTTTHLATDIVAMPLLWVIPLGLYLLSFVIAFSTRGTPALWATRIFPFVLVVAAGTAFLQGAGTTGFAVATALLTLFVAAIALHRRLYLLRPEASGLTGFYLMTALGGVIGGTFCAIVAPVLFDWVYEQPLLIAAAAMLARPRAPVGLLRRMWRGEAGRSIGAGIAILAVLLTIWTSGLVVPISPLPRLLALIVLVALAVIVMGRPLLFGVTIAALMLGAGGWHTLVTSTRLDARVRSYFGIYTIADRGGTRELISGTTLHGVQRLAPEEQTQPTSYYAPGSGVGRVLGLAPALYGRAARIGVVGLGAGTLACYARPGQDWRFYEIDPAVAAIASDPRRFTFLARCAPDARILLGDARLVLARAAAGSHDVLIVDAFSSDAVPMHLLTVEALDVYGRALAPDGILMMHVSNRFLDLAPVVAAAAARRGWSAAILDYLPDQQALAAGAGRSIWIALGRSGRTFDQVTALGAVGSAPWRPLAAKPGIGAWTDDHASILPVLR